MASDSIGKFGDSALVELIFTVENPRITEELQKLSIVPEDGQVILSRKDHGGAQYQPDQWRDMYGQPDESGGVTAA